jgi:hypothetical protein
VESSRVPRALSKRKQERRFHRLLLCTQQVFNKCLWATSTSPGLEIFLKCHFLRGRAPWPSEDLKGHAQRKPRGHPNSSGSPFKAPWGSRFRETKTLSVPLEFRTPQRTGAALFLDSQGLVAAGCRRRHVGRSGHWLLALEGSTDGKHYLRPPGPAWEVVSVKSSRSHEWKQISAAAATGTGLQPHPEVTPWPQLCGQVETPQGGLSAQHWTPAPPGRETRL